MELERPLAGARTIPLDVTLALAGQGVREGARVNRLALAAARRAVEEARSLFVPRFVSATLPLGRTSENAVDLARAPLAGRHLARALDGAAYVIAVICTIGAAADDRVSALLDADPLLALALDGLGSAACDCLAEDIRAEIEQRAAREGNRVTGRLSPGMIDWPLREGQDELFALVDPAPIGVVRTPSGQMIPRKSLSFLVGVGAAVRRQAPCAACGAGERCRFRMSHA